MDRVLFQREGPLYLSLPRVIRHDGRVVPGPFGLDEGGGRCIEGRENGSSFTTNTGDLFEDRWHELLRPGYYSAIVSDETGQAEVEQAVALKQDAIHPDASVSGEIVESALDKDLQVNVLVVDTADLTDEDIAKLMEEQIEKGSTAIIADEPAILADVLAAHPPPCP